MKKMMKTVLMGAVMLGAVSLMGAEFRIDLQVDKNICGLAPDGGSEGVRIAKADWLKVNADRRLVITGKSGEKWVEKWVQFIPAEDCRVTVQLMSPSPKVYAAYDHIRIEGASMQNGSFEQLNPKGNLQGWYPMKKPALKKTGAADGKNCVEVNHDDRFTQMIKCKKGQPVKITFMVRDVKR